MAAIDADWQKRRADLDAIFSPTVPPLDRLKNYCDYGYKLQTDVKCKCGCVLGCPLFSLGSEVSTQEETLKKKVQSILDQKRKYLESAIRDAHAAGLIHAPDAAAKAKTMKANRFHPIHYPTPTRTPSSLNTAHPQTLEARIKTVKAALLAEFARRSTAEPDANWLRWAITSAALREARHC